MYVSGSQFNLETRLHQLARTSGDFASFITEALSYGTGIAPDLRVKLNREFNHGRLACLNIHPTGNTI